MLDILAGRKTVGEIRGTVRFSGQKATRAFLKRFTGYVECALVLAYIANVLLT